MTVKIRFFARFRELLGTDIITDVEAGTTVSGTDHHHRKEKS